MSDTAIVSEQSGETRSRGSGAGFGAERRNEEQGERRGFRRGDCIAMEKVV